MKPYLLSLCAGLLVGVIYSLLNVRSPAPPAIALLGLMGILLGEQALPVAKRLIGAGHMTASAPQSQTPPGASQPPAPGVRAAKEDRS